MAARETAADRLRTYLATYAHFKQLDQAVLHSVGRRGEVHELLSADLRVLIAQADALRDVDPARHQIIEVSA